jgi:hypothetical protein
MKLQLFEFEDLSWFPDIIRESMTDYLRYLLNTVNFYEPITSVIKEGLDKTNQSQIFDLCSGSGGSVEKIQTNIKRSYGLDVPVILSDKFPNVNAYQYLKDKTEGKITFVNYSVDAQHAPVDISGLRTIFSGFHHFDSTQAIKMF